LPPVLRKTYKKKRTQTVFKQKLNTEKIESESAHEEMNVSKGDDRRYLFKSSENSANLTGLDYINDGNIPHLAHNPNSEDFDDILEVPSFQRPKITEKK